MLTLFALAAIMMLSTTTGPPETAPSPAASASPTSPLEGEIVYTNPSSPYLVLDGQLHALPGGGQPTSDFRSLYTEPGRIKIVSATQLQPMPLGDEYLSIAVRADIRTHIPFLVLIGTAPNPLEKGTTAIVRPITPAGIAQYKFAITADPAPITCNPGPAGFPPPGAQIGTGVLPPALTKC